LGSGRGSRLLFSLGKAVGGGGDPQERELGKTRGTCGHVTLIAVAKGRKIEAEGGERKMGRPVLSSLATGEKGRNLKESGKDRVWMGTEKGALNKEDWGTPQKGKAGVS